VEYAFRIYDFDNDDMLSNNDLEEVINRLTGGNEDDRQKLPQEVNIYWVKAPTTSCISVPPPCISNNKYNDGPFSWMVPLPCHNYLP